MYDSIFDDFEVIKKHCKGNGNVPFDLSAVFELLENLGPMHGSRRAIQIIIDMLDAQRIRDFKNDTVNIKSESIDIKDENTNVSIIDAFNSDSSNGSNSIIEIATPKKVYPCIDLTDTSPNSNDSLIIEETKLNSLKHDEGSNHSISSGSTIINGYDNESSDPDILRHVYNDWSPTTEERSISYEPPLLDLLSDLEEPNKTNSESDNHNSNAPEVSEILEENNNDPNNNLEGAIYEETAEMDNVLNNVVTPEVEIGNTFGNSNSNNSLIEEVIDSYPGCSKDTEVDVIKRIHDHNKSLPHPHSPLSPVAGCSKNFKEDSGMEFFSLSDNDSDFYRFTDSDEYLQKDAVCIREIIPWADFQTIIQMLKKYRFSSNRKQLTLWDLMSKSNKAEKMQNKRKLSSNACILPNKSTKTEISSHVNETPKLSQTQYSNDKLEQVAIATILSDELPLNRIQKMHNPAYGELPKNSQSSVSQESPKPHTEISNANQNEQLSENVNSSENRLPLQKETSVSVENSVASTSQVGLDAGDGLAVTAADSSSILDNQCSASSTTLATFPVVPDSRALLSDRPLVPNSEKNETSRCGTTAPIHKLLPLDTKEPPKEQSMNAPSTAKNNNESITSSKKYLAILSELFEIDKQHKNLEASQNNFMADPFHSKDFQQSQSEKSNPEADNISNIIKPAKFVRHQSSVVQFVNKSPAKPAIQPVRPARLNYLGLNSEPKLDNMVLPIPRMRNFALRAENGGTGPLDKQNIIIRVGYGTGNPSTRPNMPNTGTQQYPIMRINQPKRTGEQNILRPPTLVKLNGDRANHFGTMAAATVTSGVIADRLESTSVSNGRGVEMRKLIPGPSKSNHENPVIVAVRPSTSGTSSTADLQTKKRETPHSVYVKLRSMFPEVKKSYIKQICANPPLPMEHSNPQYILNVLVDHLLREGHNNLEVHQIQPLAQQQLNSSLTLDEKYEYLLGLFPNADPTYLREFVECEGSTDEVLNQFIQEKLETKDYPTKEQYLAKIKITEQLRQYTTNFKVENFLEIFPDPFKHFEDESRQCTYQTIAMEFLKSFFNKNKVQTISRMYRQTNYNLSLTAKSLSKLGPDMKSKRGNNEMPTENIPLLQEIAFVKNKQNILDHTNTMKFQEEALFKELKAKSLLLTCMCCYNDECMPTKSAECNASHVFCHECIVRGTEAALADGEAHVRCFTDCQSEFSLATLQKVLPPTKFSALLKKRQAAEVAAAEVDGLVSCPFCYFASIPPPEDKVFKCLNPECMKESCRMCKELNHVPLRCDELVKTDKARHMLEEKMTEALLRTCYKCKKQFYKEEGCNKMRCPCGALMCYVCDKPVSGYDHFNAQGGANANLCPLWSDDRRLNAEAVRKVAEDVKNSILKNNPHLKIDTEALLPKIPPKSRGPHDDIPNANQLPEHIRRVVMN